MSKTVFISHEKLLKGFGIESRADGEWISDYVYDNASSFSKEYQAEHGPLPEAAEYAVQDAINDKVGLSIVKRELDAFASAIEDILNGVRPGAVENAKVYMPKGRVWGVKVTVGKPFLSAWYETIQGTGFGSGETLKMSEVNANTILSAASNVPDVYGRTSMERRLEGFFDRFDPDTGSYWDLMKIVEKALKPKRSRRR